MTGMKEGAGEDPFADDADSRNSETVERDSGGQVVKDDESERVKDDESEGMEDVMENSGAEKKGESDRDVGQSTGNAGSVDANSRSARSAVDQSTDDQSIDDRSTESPPSEGQSRSNRESLEIPYKLRRDSVQDGRSRVPLFLQSETKANERDALRELEERFDEDVSLTDLREAMVVVGLERLDEVEHQLEEWGYGMTFDA